MIDEKILVVLEFDKIIDMLCQRAISNQGKELCKNLMPETSLDKIEKLQDETSNAVSLILKKNSLPLGGIKDLRKILERVKKNGVLSCEELICVADFLRVSQKVKEYATGYEGILNELFAKINCNSLLESEIENKIDVNDLFDTASEKLFSIRKNIGQLNNDARQIMNSIIRNSKAMLQDNIIAVKNNRFCLAVRSEFKNSFDGIIHEQSASGSTLFIEPAAIIAMNNKIKKLRLDEQLEINKILTDLSCKVALNLELFSQNSYAMENLDFIFARASLAISMEASEPILNENGYINLKQARHPLIDSKKVVPLDINLGNKFTTLLITGPNTGGKTVALKTVGLLTLMAQSGLHIPSRDNCQLAVFKNIFVDIGDEQSIEQNLSTFSAHMKNIRHITQNADENSLILLDELGSGTDPVEGAALAISILDYFFCKKSKVLVTSHYSELKLYAMNKDGVENASCEFDVETLSPTYKLLIGLPGKSNAFEICKRIGFDKDIIEQAKKNLSRKDIEFEDVIKNLQMQQALINEKEAKAQELFQKAKSLEEMYARQLEKFNMQKEKELENAKKTAIEILDSAKEKSSLILKHYRENNFKSAHKLKMAIDEERKKLKNDSKVVKKVGGDIQPDKLKVGDKVFSCSMNKSGIVQNLTDGNKNVTISIGGFKVKLPISDLKISNEKDEDSHSQKTFVNKSFSISPKIDVRGFTALDAINSIDKYIDDALIARLEKITIVHGKGSGVLRKAIADYLKTNSAVKDFRIGNFGEGELGVTIVHLK